MIQWMKMSVCKLSGLSSIPRIHMAEAEKEVCAHIHAHKLTHSAHTHMCTHTYVHTHTSVTNNEEESHLLARLTEHMHKVLGLVCSTAKKGGGGGDGCPPLLSLKNVVHSNQPDPCSSVAS